jgi:hypothetical protein
MPPLQGDLTREFHCACHNRRSVRSDARAISLYPWNDGCSGAYFPI